MATAAGRIRDRDGRGGGRGGRFRIGLLCAFVLPLVVGFSQEVLAGTAEASERTPRFEQGGELGGDSEPTIDRLLLLKAERRLVLFSGDEAVYEYAVALGGQPEGPKRERGDEKTPEGHYVIDWRKPDSAYHRALHVSYPNEDDRRQARERGVDPGGAIMIHGLPKGRESVGAAHRLKDWTDGCIAVTNEEMDQIWRRVGDGVAIEIRP